MRSSNVPPFRLELLALSAFLTSARLSAMASLMLTGVFGTGGSSWGRVLRNDFDGVWGVDLVRARAGETMLDEGFIGDAARERDVGGTSTFDFDGLRDIMFDSKVLSLARAVVATGACYYLSSSSLTSVS